MKFLPIAGLDKLSQSLNFDAHDCRVIGSVDIYATKATSTDKKAYKGLSKNIKTRYDLDMQAQSLSPPTSPDELTSTSAALLASPFGPLNDPSSVRTFAYLLDTLNASHPDYDFYNLLRPWDFRRERSVQRAIQDIDTTIFNLSRPQLTGFWEQIDQEMELKNCKVFSYRPEDDPFGEEGALWGVNYFFFNKTKKRVCYVWLRAFAAHDGVDAEDETYSVWGDLEYNEEDLGYPMEDVI